MSFQPNSFLALGTIGPDVASPSLGLFGPSTAANLGGGIFTVPDGVLGDIYFRIAGLTSETVTVSISMNGTNYSANLSVVEATTGLDHAAAMDNGVFVMQATRFGSPKYVKFVKSSTVESAAIAIAVATPILQY